MKKLLFIIFIIVIATISFIYVKKSTSPIIEFDNLKVEINSIHKINEFIKNKKNISILNGDEEIDFKELGNKVIKIKYKDKYNNINSKEIEVLVEDTIPPEIIINGDITINKGKKVNLLKDVIVKDNSNEKINIEVVGDYNINKVGTYNLKYVAKDSSGNISEIDFKLIVKEKNNTNNKYYIKVNKTLNVVMVYDINNNLVKTFICSTGDNTPLGNFKIDTKADILSLEGGVYGRYTLRFLKSRGMWFHSVPYFSKPTDGHWNDLEYIEYNKLGNTASLGCIRLTVKDAKWIYDNISKGTNVEIYESDSLPNGVTKPNSIKIDVNSKNRGWDPTDPDKSNPWNLN